MKNYKNHEMSFCAELQKMPFDVTVSGLLHWSKNKKVRKRNTDCLELYTLPTNK